jgi:type I restriction enzyme S subunit
MSRLDTLIGELCPDGVRFSPLSDIATLVRGNGMPKTMLTDAGVGAIHYGQIYTRYRTWTDATLSFVSPDDAKRLAHAEPGDVIITNTSENLDDVGKAVAWLGADPIVIGGHATVIKHQQDPKFLSYWFQTESCSLQKRALATGTKVIDVSAKQLMKVRVPVPPLEVQREIVRILDRFTELETSLEAELTSRRELRLAIRDRLFALGLHSSTRVKLGEIAKQYVDSFDVEPATAYLNLGVRWYGDGAFIRGSKLGADIKAKRLYRVKANQFIYNRMFVTEGSFGLVTPELSSGVVSNEFPVFDLDAAKVIPEWLYLFFKDAEVVKRVANEAEGGTKSRRRWKEDRFENFTVDLPSLQFQRETVRAMARCLELENVLRTELTARRQQYEYYRDKIITFEEPAA